MPRPKNTLGYPCEACGKVSTTRQAKYHHKQLCGEYKQVILDERERLLAIIDAYKAAGAVINVNGFGNENKTVFTNAMMAAILKSPDLEHQMQVMIRTLYFNEEYPNNMNVCVPNEKEGYVRQLYSNGDVKWSAANVDDLAMKMMQNIVKIMDHHVNNNNTNEATHRYSKARRNRVVKFWNLIYNGDNIKKVLCNTITTLILNHHMVMPHVHGIVTPENREAVVALDGT
jgi:hypothetical protein